MYTCLCLLCKSGGLLVRLCLSYLTPSLMSAPFYIACFTSSKPSASLAKELCLPQTASPLWPAAQAYLVLASVVCHCNYTHEDLLFTQVCSDPTPIHCNTGFGKKHYPLLSAAPQNRLRADLCHCKCTYEDLLFIQVCRDPQPMQCTTGFGEKHSPLLSAALENRLTIGTVSLQVHLWRFAIHTGVQ